MTIDWVVVATIAAPIIALFVGAALNRALENRPKLVAHYGHVSGFRTDRAGAQSLQVNTHSVVIRNAGRKSAKNVHVTHNYLPDFNVYPDVQYETNDLPGGGKELVFPTLIPKEEINISYLYFPPVTYDQIVTHVKSDEGAAKIINVWQVPIMSKKVRGLLWFLMVVGSVSTVYILYVLIKYVIGKMA